MEAAAAEREEVFRGGAICCNQPNLLCYSDNTEADYPKGSHPWKKVLFLWTLSVPPLAPPPLVYGRLGGSFF